jgi:type I restriction enzyme R subunit
LQNARELKNIIRLQGEDELLDLLDFYKLNQLLKEVQRRLDTLNLVDSINNENDNTNLINTALEDIFFQFTKISEEEMILADQLRNQLRQTREELQRNIDPADPEFVTLKEELERIFKNKNLDEVNQEDMRDNIHILSRIYDEVRELNRKNALLRAKYENDEKYARIHKRLVDNPTINAKEIQIYEALLGTKTIIDDICLHNVELVKNETYFNQEVMSIVIQNFIDQQKIKLDAQTTENINNLIVKEYKQQYTYN